MVRCAGGVASRPAVSDTIPPRDVRVLYWIGAIATIGFALAGFLIWRSVTVEMIEPDDAQRQFAEIRARLSGAEPILHVDALGVVTRREIPAAGKAPKATRLYVMAYLAPEQRLVRADVPFWFLKVKGPGVKYAFRDTGFDLERLGITPADLEKFGVCLLLDETRASGDHLLVWTR